MRTSVNRIVAGSLLTMLRRSGWLDDRVVSDDPVAFPQSITSTGATIRGPGVGIGELESSLDDRIATRAP